MVISDQHVKIAVLPVLAELVIGEDALGGKLVERGDHIGLAAGEAGYSEQIDDLVALSRSKVAGLGLLLRQADLVFTDLRLRRDSAPDDRAGHTYSAIP